MTSVVVEVVQAGGKAEAEWADGQQHRDNPENMLMAHVVESCRLGKGISYVKSYSKY